MSKIKTVLDRSVTLTKSIMAVPLYELKEGTLTRLYTPTVCDKMLRELRDCIRENVHVKAIISPESTPNWSWDERAFLYVQVWNKTAAFCLTEVRVWVTEIRALEGRASVGLEDPAIKYLSPIFPGQMSSANFPLVCKERFQGDDRVRCTVRVRCNPIPYVIKDTPSDEEVLRGA